MERRLKILVSAYACEPGKGSEPEVGWQWMRQLALRHDLTVLTRANNLPSINTAEIPGVRFVPLDLSRARLWLKRGPGGARYYYCWWQHAARKRIRSMISEQSFDFLHHLTYTGSRYPLAVDGHGVPWIWGPVAGMEFTPPGLVPLRMPVAWAAEQVRNANNRWSADALAARARQARLVLSATHETHEFFSKAGARSVLMPMMGCESTSQPIARKHGVNGELRLLYAGRLLAWKGLELALQALAKTPVHVTLTLVGSGPLLSSLKKLAQSLGLERRVIFRGHVPRAALLEAYAEYDAFVYPSMHDTGGFAVLEAMAAGLPIICLRAGGPATAVNEHCGAMIPVDARENVITGLSETIRAWDGDRSLLACLGAEAARQVKERWSWDARGAELAAHYEAAAALQ